MDDALKSVRPWVNFAGCVLVVVVLYWAQAVLVPVALAILLTFVLTPPVTWLERWVGSGAAVLIVVTLVFSLLGLAGWGLARQMNHLVEDLPSYRSNIRAKIADVRGASKGGTVEKLKESFEDIQTDLGTTPTPKGTSARPVVVTSPQATGFTGFTWLGPARRPNQHRRRGHRDGDLHAARAARSARSADRDLRSRPARDHDQGVRRSRHAVSRQLLMQTLVNTIYGVAVGVGLYFLDVPYPLVWAMLGAALRFIPYVGPVLARRRPDSGQPCGAARLEADRSKSSALFAVLELFTNLVLETVLYAGAAGVSQVALLVSVAFWTWLWGPLGLLMATPLTVCLVVLGKHVPGLEFFCTLMADTPALAPEYGYYQRLLARDQSEAADLIERHIKTEPPDTVYDALILPALNYAERDRIEQRLSPEEESSVIDATRELIVDATAAMRRLQAAVPADARPRSPRPQSLRLVRALGVLAYAANGVADEIALAMFAHLVRISPSRSRSPGRGCSRRMSSRSSRREVLDRLHRRPAAERLVQDAIYGQEAARYISGPSHYCRPMGAAGAGRRERAGAARCRRQHVASTLVETRDYLATLVDVAPARDVDAA